MFSCNKKTHSDTTEELWISHLLTSWRPLFGSCFFVCMYWGCSVTCVVIFFGWPNRQPLLVSVQYSDMMLDPLASRFMLNKYRNNVSNRTCYMANSPLIRWKILLINQIYFLTVNKLKTARHFLTFILPKYVSIYPLMKNVFTKYIK